ncbi:MAG: pyridoxamine 5'-phosphate oxidase family protein [Pseudomonadales bacterium]|jgi:general stress protein 26|nr:pyridoxamine 5'-phosphate oxidase family protein [Pseudomonadales bacterium]
MTTIEKAQKLHQQVNTFIITCVGEDGYPLTKAVVPGKHRESIEEIYFCTNTSSKFAQVISENHKASVYFYKRGLIKWQGCLLKGDMEIVEDMKIKEKYWQNMFKDAYPQKSFTDPDFCVLKFVPVLGRFYANYTIEDFGI